MPHILPNAEPIDLATRYFVDHLPGARIPGSRLRGILERLADGERPSTLQLAFLTDSGLLSLAGLASGELDHTSFEAAAVKEQAERVALAKLAAMKNAVERAKEAAKLEARAAAYFNDPAVIRRNQDRDLRRRYDIGYVDPEQFHRLMAILREFSTGSRIKTDDLVWMQHGGADCWTPALQKAHHWREAEALTILWRVTKDPWQAVTASGHWRKAAEPEKALYTTAEVKTDGLAPKLKAALLTTQGGASRDLCRFEEAIEMGLAAHALLPRDFRPCTLLGAVHIQTGQLTVGAEWYDNVEVLGASRRSVDSELRSILASATADERCRLAAFLLKKDAMRYAWLERDARAAKVPRATR